MKKSYAVFGLGKYGTTVVKELVKNGADVLAVDMDETVIESAKNTIPICKCADVTSIDVLTQLGISNIDTVIVSMSSHLEESVMAVMLCKELGVPNVIAKAATELNKKILLKVGADKVVIPEHESGLRLAKEVLHSGFIDVVDLSSEISMIELEVKDEWVGKSLIELDLRKKYSLNVVAIKTGDKVSAAIDPTLPLSREMLLLVIANVSNIEKIVE